MEWYQTVEKVLHPIVEQYGYTSLQVSDPPDRSGSYILHIMMSKRMSIPGIPPTMNVPHGHVVLNLIVPLERGDFSTNPIFEREPGYKKIEDALQKEQTKMMSRWMLQHPWTALFNNICGTPITPQKEKKASCPPTVPSFSKSEYGVILSALKFSQTVMKEVGCGTDCEKAINKIAPMFLNDEDENETKTGTVTYNQEYPQE